jgi:UDP-N-acetylmuramyl pentapeptide phosphotransferase/UDP-N-acetylglucosamine-1-phosphate transferase
MSVAEAGQVGWPAWLALHFAIGGIGTWLARRYALRRALLDEPGERRSHQVPTPRGGGLGIVASLLLALGWLAIGNPAHAPMLLSTAVGVALVAGIGWADDHHPLSPWPRLLVQALAAALLAWGIHVEGGSAVAMVLAWVAAMVLANVWNFMDGIDGLAASQALLVAIGYGLLAGQGIAGWLAFALAAACLGFLPFNLPRARIFLGDVGSGALGYALAALAAWLALRGGDRTPLLLLPLSAFLIDASLTLAARAMRGQRWWLPHTEHAYQHWARRSRSHGKVTLAYAAWTVGACAGMLAGRTAAPAFIIPALLVVCMAGGMGWAYLRWTPQGREDTKE